jgi:hypothetical protein
MSPPPRERSNAWLLVAIAATVLVTLLACGSAPAKPSPRSAADAPVTPNEWKALCEAQAERARRCPGPAPEPLATCTEDASCFGALVRSEVIHALAACQSQPDCTRPCTVDRVTASLPATPTNLALDEACATRRMVCPSLDCNALVRPVRPLGKELTLPLVDCMRYEKSCLDVAACVLDKMTPVLAKVSACGNGGLAGSAPEGPPLP